MLGGCQTVNKVNSKQPYDNTLSEMSKKSKTSKTCLYKPTTYKSFMLYNCMITVNSNQVSELYYPPDSSGNVYIGYGDPSLEKYQIQNSKNKCPVEVSNQFIEGLKYVTEEYKDNKTCAGLKHHLDTINCKYILNTKNKDFNMGNTKLLYQNFAKKIMDEFNLVKVNIFYTDSKIIGSINIKNKIYEINEFQRDKFGFLKYNFPTQESVFSSLIVDDSEKNYLSLSGALGSIDYEGNCDSF